ncbi:transglutaminase domain-containing protein [Fictibacillus phosphorivorans]|uniref:transglutaminase domain-containing protein n=1 Tax=Fictibacillus phosphorivorans TaxID=1221500 RepID=UPI0018E845E5
MPQSNQQQASTLHVLVLYGLGFLLLWEWLRPLKELTTTNDIQIFVMYTLFLFIVTYFQLPFWISFPVKLGAMLYALHSLYFFDVFLSFKWVPFLIEDIKYNLGLFSDQNWNEMTSLSRSLLFFILLWLVSYLMHYWLVQTRRIFLFFLITVIYISILDTFTVYDGKFAIIRTVFIGLILVGILRMMKIIETQGFSLLKGKFPVLWVAPLSGVIALSSALGYVAPKASPIWPDPVPFLQNMSGKDGEEGLGKGAGIAKIGYGENDSQLGGPFEFDYTPIFTAYDNGRHYWRIETKEFYTGKGWENKIPTQAIALEADNPSADTNYTRVWEDGLEMKDHKARIEAEKRKEYSFLMIPGKLTNIKAESDINYQLDGVNGKISTFQGGSEEKLSEYEMDYQLPVIKEEQLKASNNQYPVYITENYLQLPETLPQRVKDLAQDVTADQPTLYDKVKTVEGYFAKNAYGYNTIEVAVPKGDEDYVDQFLFETKIGYCDNFSTSMVVMLRSVGIPARWVKGFTPGTFEALGDDGLREYTVTNANAHSWVEVYFSGIGWVPFEPTRGFDNPFEPESEEKDSTPAAPVPTQPDKPEKDVTKDDSSASGEKTGSDSILKSVGTLAVVLLIGLVVIAGLAYLFRRKWLRQYTIWRYKHKKGADSFEQAFERLMWLLKVYGIKRRPAFTLREYALYVDRELDTKDMRILAKAYEGVQFSPKKQSDLWNDFHKELWENLIKRIRP